MVLMSTFLKIISYLIPLSLAFFINHLPPLVPYIPQLVALASVLIVILLYFSHRLFFPLLIFTLHLIVLATGAIDSYLFFFVYFLLFALSFQAPPLLSLVYAVTTVIIYSYSLDSLNSLIKLLSLILISPITYFISLKQIEQSRAEANLSQDETDFFLWLSLRLKKSLRDILSFSSEPQVKKIVKSLLRDAEKLQQGLHQNSDEI